MSIYFNLEDERETKSLAIYVANLVKEHVTFKIIQNGLHITVELTGGF